MELPLIAPDGTKLDRPRVSLTEAECAVIRAYQAIKMKYRILEQNHCKVCWDEGLHDGMRGHVTSNEVVYECRCRILIGHGGSVN